MSEYIKNKWRAMNRGTRFLVTAVLGLIGAACLLAGELRIGQAELGKEHFKLKFNTNKGTNSYVQIWSTDSLTGEWRILDFDWGADGTQTWVDPASPDTPQRFYRFREYPLAEPGDADNDGIDDVFEMRHPRLNPLDPSEARKDSDGDGICNLEEYRTEIKKGPLKIVLDAVSLSSNAFSPAVTCLLISAQYRAQVLMEGISWSCA